MHACTVGNTAHPNGFGAYGVNAVEAKILHVGSIVGLCTISYIESILFICVPKSLMDHPFYPRMAREWLFTTSSSLKTSRRIEDIRETQKNSLGWDNVLAHATTERSAWYVDAYVSPLHILHWLQPFTSRLLRSAMRIALSKEAFAAKHGACQQGCIRVKLRSQQLRIIWERRYVSTSLSKPFDIWEPTIAWLGGEILHVFSYLPKVPT